MTYVLIWNSHSEYADVLGVFASAEQARAAAEARRHGDSMPLEWTHGPADEFDHEQWVAICGVVDQYEVHALIPAGATTHIVADFNA